MKNCVKVLLLTSVFVFAGTLNATEYYVATTGNDTSGAGSISSPWETIEYSVSCLSAGDTLYVRGGLYRESYIDTFPSGTGESNRITVKAYKNETPIISSMIDASGTDNWTQVSGNIYSYDNATTTTYRNVSLDGIPMQLMNNYDSFDGSSSDITGENQWSRNRYTPKLWVHVSGGGNPGSKNIEISESVYTIYLQKTLQYITLEGLTIEGGYYPIQIEADYVTLKNCTFRNCYGDAVKVLGWTVSMNPPEWDSQYGIIDNCDLYYFGENGVDITGGDYWQVNNTLIHHGVKNRCPAEGGKKLNGISMKNSNVGSVVNGCRIFNIDTYFGAIGLGGASGRTTGEGVDQVVKNNIIHDISGPEIIHFTGAIDCTFINNVIYDCNTTNSGVTGASESLIQIRCSDASNLNQETCSGVSILNNIFYDNTSTYNYKETVDGSDTGATINNNCIGTTRNSYFDGSAITHSNMVSQKGYDTDSFTGVPSFINYAYGLVGLSSTSDAAEGGLYDESVQDDYECQERVINSPISIGAYESASNTVYCDGANTANWSAASGETISSVYDSGIDSYVIQTTGTASDAHTLYANDSNGLWYNDEQFIVTFKGKFSTAHAFQVRFKSSDGTMKSVKFYSNYTYAGPHTSSLYRFPLGSGSSSTEDGNWHTYVFNLSELLNQADSSESIDYIERLYLWGGGKVDDVELHNNLCDAGMPKGLVGRWEFNEGTGAYVEDTSGEGRHGTLQNMSYSDPADSCWTLGNDLKALKFDKSAHKYISIPNISESFTSGFTIDAVVRFDNLDSSYDVITAGLQGYSVYARLYEQTGYIYMQIKVDGGDFLQVMTLNNKIQAGEWHRISARCNMNDETLRIFVDGVDATDLTRYDYSFSATSLDTGTGIMYIGSSSVSGHSFEGEIDSVKLYNRPLSSEEINQIEN
jgi:Concanavalin A-like lectin/glucanases superfamily